MPVDPRLIDPLDNFRLADMFLERRSIASQEQLPGLWIHQSRWLTYANGVYDALPKTALDQDLTRFIKKVIDTEEITDTQGHLRQAKSGLVEEVISALESRVALDYKAELPMWMGPTPSQQVTRIVTGNLQILLDASTGAIVDLAPHTANWISPVRIPVVFPTTQEQLECPRWEAFLNTAMEGDQERVLLLQEITGWLLVPDTALQKFIIFDGDGGTGKGTFLRVLTELLGARNVSHVSLERFADRFNLSETLGKLANLCGDMGKVTDKVEGYLKMFTGQDRMQFEQKYGHPYSAVPTARLVFATNERPQFTDRTDGIWRRLILVPFNRQATEAEKESHLEDALRMEMPGILRWGLDGLTRLRAQGRFTAPTAVINAVKTFKAESNPARTFLESNYESDPDGITLVDAVYQAYRAECGTDTRALLSKAQFGIEVHKTFSRLDKTKTKSSDGSRLNAYKGLRRT